MPELYLTKEAIEERLQRRTSSAYDGKALHTFCPGLNDLPWPEYVERREEFIAATREQL